MTACRHPPRVDSFVLGGSTKADFARGDLHMLALAIPRAPEAEDSALFNGVVEAPEVRHR
jgi:hypothetical protein